MYIYIYIYMHMCVHRAWESSLPTKHMKVSECMVHRAWESSQAFPPNI